MQTPATDRRLRLALVGCGDVCFRRYLPALAELRDRVEIVAAVDSRSDAAAHAVEASAAWSPDARPFADIAGMLAALSPDAAFNLTPAPSHGEASGRLLRGGVNVYSEKPLAGTREDADRLIETARARGLLLLCAPAVALTRRFQWMREIVDSGRFGRLSLAVANYLDTGPATWREYTGDPSIFYTPEVGPLFDHGVYQLHGLTALLGPVAALQAMGMRAIPQRVVRAGPLAGQTIPVTTQDHLLINLAFANGALGQMLQSFATPKSRGPWLELHFDTATLSWPGEMSDSEGTASLFVDDDSPLGLEGWIHGLEPPPPVQDGGILEQGIRHFVACLRGEETPVLTAEHARHVLDVMLTVYDAIADGRTHETTTRF